MLGWMQTRAQKKISCRTGSLARWCQFSQLSPIFVCPFPTKLNVYQLVEIWYQWSFLHRKNLQLAKDIFPNINRSEWSFDRRNVYFSFNYLCLSHMIFQQTHPANTKLSDCNLILHLLVFAKVIRNLYCDERPEIRRKPTLRLQLQDWSCKYLITNSHTSCFSIRSPKPLNDSGALCICFDVCVSSIPKWISRFMRILFVFCSLFLMELYFLHLRNRTREGFLDKVTQRKNC